MVGLVFWNSGTSALRFLWSIRFIRRSSTTCSNWPIFRAFGAFFGLDGDFDNVVVAVAGGVGTFAEGLEVLLGGEFVVPEFVHSGEFEFFAQVNHIIILTVDGDVSVRVEFESQVAENGSAELTGQRLSALGAAM